jgi:hypothetical protein
MVWLIGACGNGGLITNGLLNMNFLCNFVWICEDVLYLSVRQSKGGVVGTFEDFAVSFLGALVVEVLIFGYGLSNLNFGIVSRDFAGSGFSLFGDFG